MMLLIPFVLACSGPPSIVTVDPNEGPGATLEQDTAMEDAPGVDDTGEPPDDTGGDTDTADDEADYAAFYAEGRVQDVRLTISEDTIRELNRQARNGTFEYLAGDAQINGRDFPNVGIRIKGSSTLRDFDSKPSLKIKFDYFEAGQDYAGLERITLNNMVEDSTQTKEVMAYRVFREMGFPASNANHAALYVNDEYYGLYTNLETMDDEWLKRRFSDPDGELWEANDYADFTRSGVRYWESASGPGDESGLDAVVDALRTDDEYTNVNLVLNMEQFLRWWATRLVEGDVDGYPYSLNDCYLYADPSDGGRILFIPWGVDESWNTGAPAYWRSVGGELASMCLKDDACEADFLRLAGEQLDQFATLDPTAWLAEERTAIAVYVAADSRRGTSAERVNEAQDALEANMRSIPEALRREMGL